MKFHECISLEGTELDKTDELINIQKLRIRVCCFSRSDSLNNMWAYYANNSSGFCLGYEESDIKNLGNIKLESVLYNDNISTLGSEMTAEELFVKQVFHKNMCWSCEQEVRAVLFVKPDEMMSFCNEPTHLSKDEYAWDIVPKNTTTFGADERPYRAIKKHILKEIKPKKLILGRKCEGDFKQKLIDIAKEKGIPYRKYGESK